MESMDSNHQEYFDQRSEGEYVLKESFHKLIQDGGWCWIEFRKFCGDNILWTGNEVLRSDGASEDTDVILPVWSDAAVVVWADPPPAHTYSVTMELVRRKEDGTHRKKQSLHFSGTSSQAVLPSLCGALSLIAATPHPFPPHLTLKCFATTPRTPLTSLATRIPFLPDSLQLATLSLQFVALDQTTCLTILNCSGIHVLELRQTTLDGMSRAMKQVSSSSTSTSTDYTGPRHWRVSCSQLEFHTFAKHGLLSTGSGHVSCSIETLHLQLHFAIQDNSLEALVKALSFPHDGSRSDTNSSGSLRQLRLEYLSLDDDGWTALCQVFQDHPTLQHIALAFTDNFQDEQRRLTPQRRLARTQQVLTVLESNTCIASWEWPTFQQDEGVMAQINEVLEKRKTP